MTMGSHLRPRELRQQIRAGEWQGPTAGCCEGYVQANLVILPRSLAYDFLLFCHRNPRPCPLLEVTDAGEPEPKRTAPGADLRTDVPRYRVYRQGHLEKGLTDITSFWRDDLGGFLLGCSFTFDGELRKAAIPVRHVEEGKNVSMYITNRSCVPAGRFAGPLVVTMRPIPAPLVSRAVELSSRLPLAHGAPIHVGDPEGLGIRDLSRPDFGDPVSVASGDVPVFWACGVTPQAVALDGRPELLIAHAPGHMFITDLRTDRLASLFVT
ncbi:MAG: putative hydro-lyase [Acidobacteriota bacterium]